MIGSKLRSGDIIKYTKSGDTYIVMEGTAHVRIAPAYVPVTVKNREWEHAIILIKVHELQKNNIVPTLFIYPKSVFKKFYYSKDNKRLNEVNIEHLNFGDNIYRIENNVKIMYQVLITSDLCLLKQIIGNILPNPEEIQQANEKGIIYSKKILSNQKEKFFIRHYGDMGGFTNVKS